MLSRLTTLGSTETLASLRYGAISVIYLFLLSLQNPILADGYAEPSGLNRNQPVKSEAVSSVSRNWAALSGNTLKDTLEAWASTDGWTVVWDTDTNYKLRASATFRGTFIEAITKIVDSIHVSNPELTVTVYTGNRVVHVQTLLNETR